MSPVVACFSRLSPDRVVLLILRSLVALWAAFWLWFIVASLVSEPSWEGVRHGSVIALAIVGAATAACIYPPVGGTLLIVGGVFAAWFFNTDGARALLAAPAVVLGVGFILSRIVGRRAAVAGAPGTQ